MILDLELQLARDGALPVLDAGVHELFDLAAVQTDDVIVVLALIQFEYGSRPLEMVARDQARRLELGQDSVDGRKPDIFMRFQQMLVNVFRAHVARRTGAEDLENLDARQRDLEPRLAQITGFQVLHFVAGLKMSAVLNAGAVFSMMRAALSRTTVSRSTIMHLIAAIRLIALPLIAAAGLIGAAGCVHRIDIQQGNFLDAEDIDRVALGMTRVQVRSLLGTPMVSDPFRGERWDYIYFLKKGRLGDPERRHFVVYFDESDKVTRIDRPTQAQS